MITDAELQNLIDYLQGSNVSLNNAMNELFQLSDEDLTMEQLSEIDQQIFHCVGCGWWCETSEESGVDPDELVCNNCADDY